MHLLAINEGGFINNYEKVIILSVDKPKKRIFYSFIA